MYIHMNFFMRIARVRINLMINRINLRETVYRVFNAQIPIFEESTRSL